MKLTVFNGSPKKGKNNTEVIVNKFIEAYTENNNNEIEIFKINNGRV